MDRHERTVANGARWLDTQKPGWYRLVNTSEINLHDNRHCILGQVFGPEASNYVDRKGFTRTGFWYANHILHFPIGTGFLPMFSRKTKEAWQALIEDRISKETRSDMDIGVESEPYTIEPVEDPVPRENPAPEPAREPLPEKVPEPVPA